LVLLNLPVGLKSIIGTEHEYTKVLFIPADRKPEHYFQMIVQVSQRGLHARLLSTECLLTKRNKGFVAPLYMNRMFCG
jgi:hypothetical protein